MKRQTRSVPGGQMSFQKVKRVVIGTVNDINLNHIFAFAAALSYYFVMAFFPALIALAAALALLPIPNLFQNIIGTLARVVPADSMGLIRHIVGDVISPNRGALLSLGLIGAIWTCSSGFAAMIEALNVAYDVPETRPLWKTRLLAIELMFGIGSLVTFAFTFMILGPRFGEFLANHVGAGRVWTFLWPVLRYALAITFIVLAVNGLYYLAPNLKQRFINILPGALLAVVGWILLSDGLSVYFHRFAHLNKTYGILGGGIAFLTWLYWTGFLILIGAELNSEIIQVRGDGTLPLKQPPPSKVKPVAATAADGAQPVLEKDTFEKKIA